MKSFIKKIVIFFAPFIFFWILFVIYGSLCTGDLGRESFIPFGRYDYNKIDKGGEYLVECFSVDSLVNANVVTIGDSFSRQLNNGWNSFLSDSLHSNVYNLRVRNRGTYFNYLYLVDSLIHIGALDQCDYLVVESCEKFLIQRLLEIEGPIKSGWEESPQEVIRGNQEYKKYISLDYLKSFCRVLLGIDEPVRRHSLDSCYFSHHWGRSLFYSSLDLEFMEYSHNDYETAMRNLLHFFKKINSSGIRLIFLVCADKYDMYYEHIIDEGCPRNPTFDYLDSVDSVCIVNSKEVLQPYIDRCEKDIYLFNDSHWSTIAAQIIGWKVAEIITSDR